LHNIKELRTTFNGPNGIDSNIYKLNPFTEKVSLPQNLNIVEDEEIVLPFISNLEFSNSSVTLIRYSKN